ncbi:MAG: hypothetical protein R6U64_03575 [Bacteroidales bacterium]
MKIAVIDCGTNTFHLLVAEYDAAGNHSILVNEKRDVKLGQGGLLHGEIAPEPFERGRQAFINLAALARQYHPDVIKAFATSAIRGARNGRLLVRKILETTGIKIDVIQGSREAFLIYKGVELALGPMEETTLIMDIGGGSTEFILAKDHNILWKHSFELGVSRLLQKFNPSDPLTPEDLSALQGYFQDSLEPLTREVEIHKPQLLVGCSGSFESLSSMIQVQRYQKPLDNDIKTYHFLEDDYQWIHQRLLASDEHQRREMPGLVPARIDTIVYASVFISFVRKSFNIPRMIFSNYALKEGAFHEIMQER